jgi:hypothetical protein
MTSVSVFFCQAAISYFSGGIHSYTYMKATALKISSPIQCGNASIFDVTPPTRAWGTLLAPAQFHNRSLADPHTWQAPAQNAALLEESTRIGLDPSKWRGECPENGALEPHSRGTFLHVARQTRRQPSQLHYISQDHPNAHELTDKPHTASIAWTRPAVARRPRKVVTQVVDCPSATNWYKRHFSRILWIGIKYRIGFCGRARVQLANQLIPTNLNKINKVNDLNNYNNLQNDNNHNNHNNRDKKLRRTDTEGSKLDQFRWPHAHQNCLVEISQCVGNFCISHVLDNGWYRHGAKLSHGTLQQRRNRWRSVMWTRNIRCAAAWRIIPRFFVRFLRHWHIIVIGNHCSNKYVNYQ